MEKVEIRLKCGSDSKEHPRVKIVNNAKLELMKFLIKLREKLTEGEYLKILSEQVADTWATDAKYRIRMERHGNYDKSGDDA
jgi:hypothetical protein